MAELGYALSSEEHGPNDLVRNAARAEEAGFGFALISDHYHPWIGTQGEASFVWTVLGGIARETDDIRVGTGVTCPTTRVHPAIVAQAAATAGDMFDGRFFLGVGTGERLNEHVLGDRWPPHHIRIDMLEEAVGVIRELWSGGMQSHDGEHYTVENAELFTLPDEPPEIAVAASGPETAATAGRIGDALVSTAPTGEVVEAFVDAADGDALRYGQATVCWGETESEARETVHEWWPNGALPGEMGQELAIPTHFEQAAELVTEEDAVEHTPCGPDADRHVEAIEEYVGAGFDQVYVHQIGPDQAGFLEFYEEEVLPSFE
jgi:G6PDH family F420-dependent oxidoreductase